MPPIPVSEKTDLITCEIMVNGSLQSDKYQVLTVEVVREINHVPYANITILDGDPSQENFPASDASVFVPGAEIEVRAGYHENINTVFRGIIMRQSLKVNPDQGPLLIVECKDKAVKMTVGRKSASYSQQTDSAIISSLIGAHGLTGNVKSTSAQHKELVQYYSTDWDFMICRAEANGYIVYATDGTVHVEKPDTSSQPVLEITYGYTLLSFESTMDSRDQYPSVTADVWNISQQNVSKSEGEDPGLTLPGNLGKSDLDGVTGLDSFQLQSAALMEDAAAQAWANGILLRSELSKNRGKVRFQGSSLALPGKILELKGLGNRFNGKVYISSVRHEIEDGNWTTEAGYGLSAQSYAEIYPDVTAPSASGLLPGIGGLHTGKVKQIQQDPDGQFRVLVTLPLIAPDGTGIWARLGGFYATKGAGSFFFPEADDEVVLGFMNNDPSFPVILGSVYSSAKNPAYTPDEKNSTKAFVTAGQLKIVFDDENKIMQLLTPGGHKITLSDKDKSIQVQDSNNNTIEMKSDGIILNSQSAITIEAKTDISLKAGANISLSTSAGDIKLSALNIESQAEMALANKGGLSAEFSADGEVTVKGTLVMIN